MCSLFLFGRKITKNISFLTQKWVKTGLYQLFFNKKFIFSDFLLFF